MNTAKPNSPDGEIHWAFIIPIRRWRSCQEYLRNHVVILAVLTLLMKGTARSIRNKQAMSTKSMAETNLYAVGMDGHGKESVIAM